MRSQYRGCQGPGLCEEEAWVRVNSKWYCGPHASFVDVDEGEEYMNVLENVITFLKENEQYGDDWQEEIKTLENLIKNKKEKCNVD